jgi:hypothetical protein
VVYSGAVVRVGGRSRRQETGDRRQETGDSTMGFAICTITLNNIQVKKSRMKWTRYVAPVGKEINTYWILVGKPEGKTPLGRPKRR